MPTMNLSCTKMLNMLMFQKQILKYSLSSKISDSAFSLRNKNVFHVASDQLRRSEVLDRNKHNDICKKCQQNFLNKNNIHLRDFSRRDGTFKQRNLSILSPSQKTTCYRHNRVLNKHGTHSDTVLTSHILSASYSQCSKLRHQLSSVRYFSVISDPENKGESQRGVNFDTLGTWNNRIKMPILMKESIKMGKLIPKIPLDEVGQASLIGRRLVNEDRFIFRSLSADVLCFGIFDGHAGSVAADYVKDHVTDHVTYWLSRTTDLDEVLQQSFIDINNVLARQLYYYHLGTSNFNTGTTATVCLVRHGVELVVAHVGDTRAILCREGQPVRLSEDHHPERRDEADRIKQRGGFIMTNSLGIMQINGRLAMTRSIGDMELKHIGVIAKPEVHSIKLKHGKDAFLLLTSDGVSFVLNDQEMVDIVCSCSNPKEAANFITDQALQFGSEDNTTCVVIPLGAWGKYRNTTRSIRYSFGRNLVGQRYS